VPAFSQNDYPVYAEEAIVPAAALVARPDGMDAVSGAAVWMPYVTVYGMTQEVVRARPGDRVLITAANNSIGLAAVAVCRHLGAVPVVTAPAAHRTALLAAGAEEVIAEDVAARDVAVDDAAAADAAARDVAARDVAADAATPDRGTGLTEAVLAATGGHGADLVLDAVGGPAVEQLVRGCAPGAAMIVHGGLSGRPTPLPGGAYAPVWLRRYHVFEVTTDAAALRRAEHFVRSGLAVGAFSPSVDRVFDFADVAAAHTYLDSPNRAPGKPVLTVR
jgi:NADPH:quinone reductase-like Zn-dependent oxidoreductase